MKLQDYLDKYGGIKLACRIFEVEKKCMKLGIEKYICNQGCDSKFIYINKEKIFTTDIDLKYFLNHPYKELTLTEFMSIEEPTEEKNYDEDEIIKNFTLDTFEETLKQILKRIDDTKKEILAEVKK